VRINLPLFIATFGNHSFSGVYEKIFR